jgi:site-specific recombinase XerD
MARKWLPANVTAWKDRHGKTRYRFRRKGHKPHNFRAMPGTEAFREESAEATAAILEPGAGRAAAYSYGALIESFYRSKAWNAMRDSSRQTYRGIIERFRAKNGDKDARAITAAAIDAKLANMAETPAAANNLRKALKRLHRHAVKLGWRADNPVDHTDGYKAGPGWHCWTEAEIAAYRARWALGTRERLAMELLLDTALRESDAVTVGRQHRQGDELHLHHGKNDSSTVVPIGAQLDAAMAAFDSGNMTYLATQYGRPFTPKGFYNWFKRACVKAGLAHCSPHGLRKAQSRRLAESGATALEGRAVTGHKTDREFAHYAESADKRALARSAKAKLVANEIGKPNA